MFGEKEKITIEITKDILNKSREVFQDKNIDMDRAVSLLLKKFLEENTLLDEYLLIYESEKSTLAKNHLLNELNKGVESFNEMEIESRDILGFLGLDYG